MAVLLIGAKERADIAAAIERARKKPITLDWLRKWGFDSREHKDTLRLADRKVGFPEERLRAQQVLIPYGYRAAVSFEEQPEGMCLHLSISVERDDPNRMPSVEAVQAIASAFGIDPEAADYRATTWMEEYEPGRHAINIVTLHEPRKAGHA